MARITYSQACRENAPACTCTICLRPMRYASPQVCDRCYDEMSKAGQLRQESKTKEPSCHKS